MNSRPSELIVILDAQELGSRRPVGVVRRRPGPRPVISFEYARSWLERPGSFSVDPSLPLVPGETFASDGGLPGILSDTVPDRWGRRLLERREAADARHEKRTARSLDDWDFLVGVADETRMGALRLGTPSATPLDGPWDGPFLDDREPGIPPMTHLRSLEFAARMVEQSPAAPIDDPTIALLVAPGSSLGGARPKANFAALDGSLWIAKFPSPQDRRDVGGWEYLLARLARSAGIVVADSERLSLSAVGSIFATRRFDRDSARRHLFASALTLTGKRDGDEASYLDLALAVADYVEPAAIEDDLAQLFRRLVFNIMVGNRDDHLRNHGFLRGPAGWRLAPAFDLNPMPEATEHALAIDDTSHVPDVALAIETRLFYRLAIVRANQIVREVETAAAGWERLALDVGLAADDIEVVRGAFWRGPATLN